MSPAYLLQKVVKENTAKLLILCCLYTITTSGPVADQISSFSHLPRDPSLSHKTFMVSYYAFHFIFCFTHFILSFSSYWPCLGLGMCILHTAIEMNDVSVYAHMCICVCTMEMTDSPLVTKHSIVFLPDIRHSENGTLSWKGSLNRSET